VVVLWSRLVRCGVCPIRAGKEGKKRRGKWFGFGAQPPEPQRHGQHSAGVGRHAGRTHGKRNHRSVRVWLCLFAPSCAHPPAGTIASPLCPTPTAPSSESCRAWIGTTARIRRAGHRPHAGEALRGAWTLPAPVHGGIAP
jgi:hypothetical protein